jgi:hypothetical protein
MLNGNIIDDYSSMNSEEHISDARKPVRMMSKIKQNKKARIDLDSVHEPVANRIEEEVESSSEEEDIAGAINSQI